VSVRRYSNLAHVSNNAIYTCIYLLSFLTLFFHLKNLIYILFISSSCVLISMMILFVCPVCTICNNKCSFDK
jgi:hypothetical protein